MPTLIGGVTFAVFAGALGNEFVSWDDDTLLLHNRNYRGFTPDHLRWMFTTFHLGHYQPLTWLTYAVDHALWGLDPRGYHLTNVLLHALNAVLVFALARRLYAAASATSCGPGASSPPSHDFAAALAALLFALHPLRVESVAWATERRDVLSTALFLLTLLTYWRAVRPARGRSAHVPWLTLAIVLGALTVLAKAIGVVLPAVLLVLNVYPLRRLTVERGVRAPVRTRAVLRVGLELLPFVLMAIIGSVVAVRAQHAAGAAADAGRLGLDQRLLLLVHSLAFYVWKTLVPCKLAPLYEYPYGGLPLGVTFWASAATVVLISTLTVWQRRRWPGLPAAWVVYVVCILPVSGIFLSGSQMAADRYSYIACIGFAVLAGGAALGGPRQRAQTPGRSDPNEAPPPRARSSVPNWLAGAVAVVLLAVLAGLTRAQIGVWRDSHTLWNTVIQRYPGTSIAYVHRGGLYLLDGDLERAEADLRAAAALYPGYGEALALLGYVRTLRGDFAEGESFGRQALAVAPDMARAHKWYGLTLVRLNRLPEAVRAHEEAVRLAPGDWEARLRLASLLQAQRRLPEALRHAEQAVRDAPPAARVTCLELLAALQMDGGYREHAVMTARELLRLDPQNAMARQVLADPGPGR